MKLQPMALVKGKAPKNTMISYHNPKSIYGDWRVVTGNDGRFEIPVPTDDVALKIGATVVTLRDLKPQEVRVLEIP